MSVSSVASSTLARLQDNTGVNLHRGARNQEVRELQDALRALGFDPGPTDGYFGSMTEAAVRRFQQANGLVVDGWVGNQSWGAMRAHLQAIAGAAPAAPAASASSTQRPDLRRGAQGPAVTELQQRLQQAGFYHANVDGDFGPVTERAVRAFQASRGLHQDGWVGPQTWGALLTGSVPVQGGSTSGTPPTPATDVIGGPNVDTLPSVTLRRGSQGAEVRLLQLALIQLGHLSGPESVYADGDFGPVTERAVRSFQRAAGITVDGVVGSKETWPALKRAVGNVGGVSPGAAVPGAGSATPGSEAELRQKIVAWAVMQANDPTVGYRNYEGRFGNITHADGRRYFDCSGLVYAAYDHFGIPWGADDNWTGGMINGYDDFADLIPKDLAQMQPGDLVVYRSGNSGHVVMYIGDGKFVGAQTGNTDFVDQVTVGNDITRYFDKPNAIVLRPRITAEQVANAPSSVGWAELGG